MLSMLLGGSDEQRSSRGQMALDGRQIHILGQMIGPMNFTRNRSMFVIAALVAAVDDDLVITDLHLDLETHIVGTRMHFRVF